MHILLETCTTCKNAYCTVDWIVSTDAVMCIAFYCYITHK